MRIKRAAIEGREVYEVTMPDGKRALASSPQEVIGFCNALLVQSIKPDTKAVEQPADISKAVATVINSQLPKVKFDTKTGKELNETEKTKWAQKNTNELKQIVKNSPEKLELLKQVIYYKDFNYSLGSIKDLLALSEKIPAEIINKFISDKEYRTSRGLNETNMFLKKLLDLGRDYEENANLRIDMCKQKVNNRPLSYDEVNEICLLKAIKEHKELSPEDKQNLSLLIENCKNDIEILDGLEKVLNLKSEKNNVLVGVITDISYALRPDSIVPLEGRIALARTYIREAIAEIPNDNMVNAVNAIDKIIDSIPDKEFKNVLSTINKKYNSEMSPYFKDFANLTFKLENINDPVIINKIKDKLEQIVSGDGYWEIEAIFENCNQLADIYHNYNGNYGNVNGELHNAFKEFQKRYIPKTKLDKLTDKITSQTPASKTVKNLLSNSPDGQNFRQDAKLEGLKIYIEENKADKQLTKELYDKYYLSELPENTRAICDKIAKEFDTKLFLIDSADTESAQKIYNELNLWHKASDGNAELPPYLDLSRLSYVKFIKNETSAAAFASTTQKILINGPENIDWAIRHETLHINDKFKSEIFGVFSGHDFTEAGKILTEKTWNRDEFRNAGIPEGHIDYAYTNRAEFIAVAAEGNFAKYSPEFKKVLVELGMPEWCFRLTDETMRWMEEMPEPYRENSGAKIISNSPKIDLTDETMRWMEEIPEPYRENSGAEIISNSPKIDEKVLARLDEFNFTTEAKSLIENCLKQSDTEAQNKTLEMIDHFKNKAEKTAQEKDILNLIDKCKNSDGSINPKALVFLKNNFKYGLDDFADAKLQMLDSTKNSNGSFNDSALDAFLGLSKYITRSNRKKLMNYCKNDKGEFIPERLAEINNDTKLKGENDDMYAEVFLEKAEAWNDFTSKYKDENGNISADNQRILTEIKDKHDYIKIIDNDAAIDLKHISKEYLPKIAELENRGYDFEAIRNFILSTKDSNGKTDISKVDSIIKAGLSTESGIRTETERLINLRQRQNPTENWASLYDGVQRQSLEKPEKLGQLMQLLHIEGRTKQLTSKEIFDILSPYQRKDTNVENIFKYNLLKDVEGRTNPLEIKEVIELSRLSENILQNIQDRGLLKDITERENMTFEGINPFTKQVELKNANKNLSANDVKWLAEISDERWNNAKERNLLGVNVNGKPLRGAEMVILSSLSDIEYKNVVDRGLLAKCNTAVFGAGLCIDIRALLELAKINSDEWSNISRIGLIDEKTGVFKVIPEVAMSISRMPIEKTNRITEFNLLKYLDEPGADKLFVSQHILHIARMREDLWQNVLKNDLLSVQINDRGQTRTLNLSEVNTLSQLDAVQWQNAIDRKLFDVLHDAGDVEAAARLDKATWDRLIQRDLFNIEISNKRNNAGYIPVNKRGDKRNLKIHEAIELSKLNDIEFKTAQNLFEINGRENQFAIEEIAILAKQESAVLNAIQDKGLLESYFTKPSEIILLSQLEGEHWYRASSLISQKKLQADDIIKISTLSDEHWNNISQRQLLGKYNKADEIIPYAQLDNASWNNISSRQLFDLVPNYRGELIAELITAMAELPEKTFEKLKEIKEKMQTEDSKNEFYDLAHILLNPDKIAEQHLSRRIEALSYLSSLDEAFRIELEQAGLKIGETEQLLSSSLGKRRDVIDTPEKTKFLSNVIANNKPQAETVLKEFDFSQFGKEGIPLKYSRDNFVNDINNLVKDLPIDRQNKLLNYFGLTYSEKGIEGLWNNKSIDDSGFSHKMKVIAEKVKTKIEDFTIKNEVDDLIIYDPAAGELLNSLVKGCPEFTSTIGKQQHGTHAYSVDIHTLKVLQSAVNDPLYKSLSDQDKTILKMSILLHDLGKTEGVVDTGHAKLSSDYTFSILDKFNLPTRVKDRIVDIVDNHHWFESFNKGWVSAEEVAVRCRRPEDFIIYQIFSKSDFANVNDNFHLNMTGCKTQAEFDEFMFNKMQPIKEKMDVMHSKANIVLDTQFTQADKKFPIEKTTIDGKELNLRVLNLVSDKTNNDLFEYGFAPGTTKNSARFSVHMVSEDKIFSKIGTVKALLNNPTNQSTWSTSLIKLENNKTYSNRKFGFILDIDQANISEANYANTGSGVEKSIGTFTKILFNNNNPARTYVRDNFKVELSKRGFELNDKEYGALAEYLYSKKYTTQIKDFTIGDKTIKAQDLIEALEISRDKLFEGGDIHSEIVPINPRAKGLIARASSLEECPKDFINFAAENNLPIILIGYK
ncbi:MAG: hypothetical protein LBK53_03595 [Heliobacteriaceae bacterium]|nr:hypothetical protein [Heliobacteriaceae bacterium]